MSLLAFQRALADMAASPQLCRRVIDDAASALAAYELTPVEHRRAASVAAQRGMVINCRMHRTNRSSTILTLLRASTFLLGKALRDTFDRFWADYPTPDFTTRREIRRFVGWLVAEVEVGRIDSPFLPDVAGWEQAVYDVGMVARKRTLARVAHDAERWPDGPLAPHPLVRVAAFRHDPDVLLPLAARREPLPWNDVPRGEFHILVDARGPERRYARLDLEYGRRFFALQQGAPADAESEIDAELLEDGLLVRTAPSESPASTAAEPALAGAV